MDTTSLSLAYMLVFFVYGLAFFSLGLAITLEARRSPILADAQVLAPLAVFGILHGIHEWSELFMQVGNWYGIDIPPAVYWGRQALLVLSFSSLILFGLMALQRQGYRLPAKSGYILVGWVGVYTALVLALQMRQPLSPILASNRADILARYLLAFPGALLAALALWGRSRQLKASEQPRLSGGLDLAAWSFFLYGLTQLVVPPGDILLSGLVNSTLFFAWTNIPIQLVRAILAILATVGVLRSIQAAEEERQHELAAAQQARLDALERVQQELRNREALRRELLRHTVIAQEDERARIARELHDETAQILTALTLELATLRTSVPSSRSVTQIIDRMQGLSRQMSQGIYRLVRDLRPAQLDDLGLVATLRYLADQARQQDHIDVVVNISGSQQRLDLLVETVLFRIAQEALSNVARHAACPQAWLNLKFNQGKVILSIQDNGVGFNSSEELRPPRGWGIAGMRERAESVGGSLRVHSAPGKGTLVEAVVPLPDSSSAAQEVEPYELDPVDIG